MKKDQGYDDEAAALQVHTTAGRKGEERRQVVFQTSNIMSREIPDREGEPVRRDYQPPATWASDLQVLKSMIFADVKGATQQERLEAFYVSQASLYDSYRHRMLHGRLPMAKLMPAPKGGVWVDMVST